MPFKLRLKYINVLFKYFFPPRSQKTLLSLILRWRGDARVSGVFAQVTAVMSASYPPTLKRRVSRAYVCVCLFSLQSLGTNMNEELMASQSLIQIPVAPQWTSGVIICWCLILYLFSLSLPVVSMTYNVLSLKAADLLRAVLATALCLNVGNHLRVTYFLICFSGIMQ